MRKHLRDSIVKGASAEDRPVDLWDTVMPGFGLRVQPGGTKTWQILVAGERRKIGTFPRWKLAEARERARLMLQAVEAGEDPFSAPAPSLSFAELASEYLRDYSAHQHSPEWHQEVKRTLDTLLLPALGDRPAGEIQRAEIVRLMDGLRSRGASIPGRVHAILSGVFGWALPRGHVATNPLAGIKRDRIPSRQRVLSESELRTLWPMLEDSRAVVASVAMLVLATAQRPSVIRSLEWPTGRWVERETSKSGERHFFYLNDLAMAVLAPLRHHRHPRWVFHARRGASGHTGVSTVGLVAIRNAAGIPHWHVKDLQRSATTLMASCGVDPFLVDRIIGHLGADRRSATARIYDRYSYRDEIREAMVRYGERLAEVVRPRIGQDRGRVVEFPG